MAQVTYFVALPFIDGDDSLAPGEATECFSPMAVVMRAEALSRGGKIGCRYCASKQWCQLWNNGS
jgi:hypothetical protein